MANEYDHSYYDLSLFIVIAINVTGTGSLSTLCSTCGVPNVYYELLNIQQVVISSTLHGNCLFLP